MFHGYVKELSFYKGIIKDVLFLILFLKNCSFVVWGSLLVVGAYLRIVGRGSFASSILLVWLRMTGKVL